MEREEEGGRIPAIRMDPRDVKMYRFWEGLGNGGGCYCIPLHGAPRADEGRSRKQRMAWSAVWIKKIPDRKNDPG